MRTLYYLRVRVHCPSVVFTKLTQCAHVYTYAEAIGYRSNIVPSYVKIELTIKVNLLNEYKNIIKLNADSRNSLYICRGNIVTQLKFIIMVSIDFKDLCIFEQLLKEKLERLSRGVDLTQHSKNTHLYRNFVSDYYFYSTLYEEICDKILISDFPKYRK